MAEQAAPTCPECRQIVWPNDPQRLFLWTMRDPESDNPPEPGDARGAVTHADCADAFAERLRAASSD